MASRSVDKPWKVAERWLAELFGTTRSRFSGGTSDGSDSVHPKLHLECKYSLSHSAFRIWSEATLREKMSAKKEKRESRPVVVGLVQNSQPRGLVCFHSEDFGRVAAEWAEARFREKILEQEGTNGIQIDS